MAFWVYGSLILQSVGCSSTDPCINDRVNGDAPDEYYVTYDSIQCMGKGKEVVLSLKDSSVVQGGYWGIDHEERPRAVYVILQKYLSMDGDTLKDRVPAASERIIVYGFPSHSVLFEGVADDEGWHRMMRTARRELHYMTPQLVVTPISTTRIDQGSSTVDVQEDERCAPGTQ
jgi:hypothetical protein